MLQYLLNATAIWLISLVLFDVFLRRESYHGYNRFYLLVTFVLGALLPLIQFQDAGWVRSTALSEPVQNVISVKQTIVYATAPSAGIEWERWLWVVYGAGVAVALGLLIVDIIKLVVYYRNGSKSISDGWCIVQTGKDHSPFSLMNTLYVGNQEQYSEDEWKMILAHEREHTRLLHVVDMVAIQLGKMLFWFHPLVYVFNSRLLLVHEYQADNATAKQPQAYGSFLVEQALLQAAPSIAHSFNRSPIKNRLKMLTRKSTALAQIKMLVFIPLALISFICFSKNVFSREFERKGNKVKYNGNTIELSKTTYDTIEMENPVTNKVMTKISVNESKPIKLNNKPVAQFADKQPEYKGKDGNLRDYLVKNIVPELSKLKDGMYALEVRNILIDEKGNVVYFEYQDLKRSKTGNEVVPSSLQPAAVQIVSSSDVKVTINDSSVGGGKPMTLVRNSGPAFFEDIDDEMQKAIYNKVCKLMKSVPKFQPGSAAGKKVISTYTEVMFLNHFKVSDNKVYDIDRNMQYTKQL